MIFMITKRMTRIKIIPATALIVLFPGFLFALVSFRMFYFFFKGFHNGVYFLRSSETLPEL